VRSRRRPATVTFVT